MRRRTHSFTSSVISRDSLSLLEFLTSGFLFRLFRSDIRLVATLVLSGFGDEGEEKDADELLVSGRWELSC